MRLGISFVPHYDETTGTAVTASDRAENPRLLYVLTEGEEAVAMDALEKGGEAEPVNGIRLTFDDYRYYTGLQAKYDPGVKVIFAGFLLIFAGLILRYAGAMKKEQEKAGEKE